MSSAPLPPQVFVSYSHDSPQHKDWVLQLATRLEDNGVHILLDQWDIRLGSDLAHFMEQGLTSSNRVLAICSEKYVTKANAGTGGVGYEKAILTAELMKNADTDRIIPILRSNSGNTLVPIFLGSRAYIDFRVDSEHEVKYAELVRDIHGERIKARPKRGQNPFKISVQYKTPRLEFSRERYVNPALDGTVFFDFSSNNGLYIVGNGDMAFETKWGGGANNGIYAYSDPPSISSVALAIGAREIIDISNAASYDNSSRVQRPQVGEIMVWENSAGYFLATKIEKVQPREGHSVPSELVFTYKIAQNKLASFAH